MVHLCYRWSRRIAVGLLALFLTGCLLVGVSFAFLYYFAQSGQLQSWLSDIFEAKVDFQFTGLSWHYLNPVVKLKSLTLYNKTTTKPALTIQSAAVQWNIWRSIWNQSFVTQEVNIANAAFTLKQNAQGQWVLWGQNPQSSTGVSWSSTVHWLELQPKIGLSNINITIKPDRAGAQPVNLLVNNGVWQAGSSAHQVTTQATFAFGSHHFPLKASLHWKGNLTSDTSLQGRLDFSGKDSGVFKLNRLLSLEGDTASPGLSFSRKSQGHQTVWTLTGQYIPIKPIYLLGRVFMPAALARWPVSGQVNKLNLGLSEQKKEGVSVQYAQLQLSKLAIEPTAEHLGLQLDAATLVKNQSWFRFTLPQQTMTLLPPEGSAEKAEVISTSALIDGQKLKGGWQVLLDHLKLSSKGVRTQLYGQAQLPLAKDNELDWKKGQLIGVGHFAIDNLPQHWVWLTWLPSWRSTLAWMKQHIVQLGSLSGSILYHGGLEHPLNHLTIQGQLDQGAVLPSKGWPLVSNVGAQLNYHARRLLLAFEKGTSFGVNLTSGSLSMSKLGETAKTPLSLSLHAKGSPKQALAFLHQAPVWPALAPVFEQIGLSKGQVAAEVQLHTEIGAAHTPEPTVDTHVHFDDVNLIYLAQPELEVQHINGQIEVKGQKVKSIGALRGEFWQQPFHFTFAPSRSGDSDDYLVQAQGDISLPYFSKHYGPEASRWLSGHMPFDLDLSFGPKQTQVDLRSNLTALAVDLPAPFAKPAGVSWPAHLKVVYPNNTPVVDISGQIGQVLAAQAQLNNKSKTASVTTARIQLFPQSKALSRPLKTGVHLVGHLPQFDLARWIDVFDHLPAGGAQNSLVDGVWPIRLNLTVGQARLLQQDIDNLQVSGQLFSEKTQLSLTSKKLQGQVSVNWQKAPAVSCQLDHWYVGNEGGLGKGSQSQDKLDLSGWPQVDCHVNKLYWNNNLWGRLRVKLQPQASGIWVKEIQVHDAQTDVLASGHIKQISPSQAETDLTLKVNSQNWQALFTRLGVRDFMEQGKGSLTTQLHWQSKGLWPALSAISATGEMDLKDGVLASINPGMAKLLGLVSVSSLARRLSLNFSDISEKGLAFDSLSGALSLQHGQISSKLIQMSGPAMDLAAKGAVDLLQHQLNLAIVVMPNISSGLAVAATLVGGPIAGVATWVADKLLTNTVLKDRGLVYYVRGDWRSPTVTSQQ